MYLLTSSIGYAVPQPSFDATVHSVFQSAANLRLSKSGKLLTLVVSGEADLPQGIRVDTLAGFSFNGSVVGESVICRNGILRLESLALTVDLTHARPWKCDLPAVKTGLTNPLAFSAWQAVWQVLNRRQLSAGAEIVADDLFRLGGKGVAQKASQAVRTLLESTRQFDLTDPTAIHDLIGLGPGLTPCGDDLLAGYLAGLWCATNGNSKRRDFISGLGCQIVRCSRRTNDISRAYLYHAARGQVSSRLAALAEAISYGESGKALLNVAENAMRAGHSSGMDAVTGLLLGLAAWDVATLPPWR